MVKHQLLQKTQWTDYIEHILSSTTVDSGRSERRDDRDLTMQLNMRERMNESNNIGGRLGRKEEKG
jgi:hypothetical protein